VEAACALLVNSAVLPSKQCTSSGNPAASTSRSSSDDVDLVVIGLPHYLHVEAGKGVLCTKPLGRNADEARACLQAFQQANVWHGYSETEIFVPAVRQAKHIVDTGAIGDVYWVRAWFLDPSVPTEVLAWGDRLARDDVESEDSAVALIRFPDRRIAQVEVGWGHKAGLDVRTEIHGSNGYIATDHTGQTGIRAFAGESAGYVFEKAGSDRGWIAPVPDEQWSYGHHSELDHFVHAFPRR
jgi:predicted dehydrogenase